MSPVKCPICGRYYFDIGTGCPWKDDHDDYPDIFNQIFAT